MQKEELLEKDYPEIKKFYTKKNFLLHRRNLVDFETKNFDRIIIIRLRSNNIFCTYNDYVTKKTLYSCMANKYRIKISAKNLQHEVIRVITFFFNDIKLLLEDHGLIVKVVAPKRQRAVIFRWCQEGFLGFLVNDESIHSRAILYQIKNTKAFNGCRVKKRVRDKRRYVRYYKKAK